MTEKPIRVDLEQITPTVSHDPDPWKKNPPSFYGMDYLDQKMDPGTVTRWDDNGIFYGLAVGVQGLTKLTPIKSILEVGCGRGWVVRHLRNLGFIADGMEYSDEAVRFSVCESRKGDLTEKLPYDNGSYDLVLCIGVLSHLPATSLINAANELARVSKRFVWTNIQLAWHSHQLHHKTFLPHEIWSLIFAKAGLREAEEYNGFLKKCGLDHPLRRATIWDKVHPKQSGALNLWQEDAEFLEVLRSIAGITLVDQVRAHMLWQISRSVSDTVLGDIAEVGVYKGGTALLLSKAVRKGVKIHLFDTFKGIPAADAKKDLHKAGDFSDASLERVQGLFKQDARVSIHPGVFPETAKELSGPFSFVHVDVDVYESTLKCLEYFSPKMSRGGILVVDDYGFPSCPGARNAVDEYFKGEGFVYLPTGQCVKLY